MQNQAHKDDKDKSNKSKTKKKNKSEICRYLWFNEYYADRQNRLQKERLQVYLKQLHKEKIGKLIGFMHQTEQLMDEHKRCLSSTGRMRENYHSIVESRNDSALDSYLNFYSTGPFKRVIKPHNIEKEVLREQFQNSIKATPSFKKPPKSAEEKNKNEMKLLKKVVKSSDEEDDDDDDDDSIDYDIFDKESNIDEEDRKVLNYDDNTLNVSKNVGKTNRSVSVPLNKLVIPHKPIYEIKSKKNLHPPSAPPTKKHYIKPNMTGINSNANNSDIKNAKKRITEMINRRLTSSKIDNNSRLGIVNQSSMKKRSQSAQAKLTVKPALKVKQKNDDYAYELLQFPNETMEQEYLKYLEQKERLLATKPDKIIINIKMRRDPIFSKRYKQLTQLKTVGRAPEFDSKDCFIPPLSMTKTQIKKEKEKIVNLYGHKYDDSHHNMQDDNGKLKQKVDDFIKSITKFK